MKKRILSMLLAICMVVGLLPGVALPAAAAETAGEMTVYFQNNWLWTDVQLYYWGSAGTNPGWPGNAMEKIGNDGTYDIYKATVPTDVTGIIVSGLKDDGSGTRDQTPDITSGWYDGICYSMTWSDGNGVNSADIADVYPDAVPATITGVSITVDGTNYESGNVTITPDSTVTLTVTGINLQNGTSDNVVYYSFGTIVRLTNSRFDFSEDGTTATYTRAATDFNKCSNFEIKYANDYTTNGTAVGTGIYITYDAGISEEDKAVITGVSITVDGTEYTSGNVTITPDSTVTLTVTGTNLQNGTSDNIVHYASGRSVLLTNSGLDFSEDGTTATYTRAATDFNQCSNFEIKYANDYTTNDTAVGTGIYVTYDAGISEEDKAVITGVSINVDGKDYNSGNVTIYSDSTVILTVTGTNLQNGTTDNYVIYSLGLGEFLNSGGFVFSEDGTSATNNIDTPVYEGDSNYEIVYYNDYTTNRTAVGSGIYVTYNEGTKPATSGTTGDCAWSFDAATGTLTISGTGAMPDYTTADIPWAAFQSRITQVVIEDGVTAIGNCAFYGCGNLTTLTMKGDIASVGDNAFVRCNSLTTLYYYGTQAVEDGSFPRGVSPTIYVLAAYEGAHFCGKFVSRSLCAAPGCTGVYENGVCTVCGTACPHKSVDAAGLCACGVQMEASLTDGDTVTYYATL